MTINRINRASIAALSILITAVSCDRSRNDKGYEYFPDMAHSLAYETYAPNPNFGDSMTMRLPAENTISREIMPYPYPNTPEVRALNAVELSNTLE